MESGTVKLINTKTWPFNDSARLVALEKERSGNDYIVAAELLRSDGEAGEIIVSDKAVNGFSIAFTGSASQAEIRYWIVGDGL